MASLACSVVYTEASMSTPMARRRWNTRVMAGTPKPMASSSSPWAKTSRGAPEKGIRPSLITTSRSTVRATSSMEWETMMIVAFLAV